MGYQFDRRGFMIIPDPREYRRTKEEQKQKCVVATEAYCPNGHNLIDDYVNFNGFGGIKLKIRRPNGEEGFMVLSPIFGDKTVVYIGTKPADGEKLEVFCPECGTAIPVLKPCDECTGGELRVLSVEPKFTVSDGIAFCDLVGCPSAYIISAGELVERAYIEGLE